MPSRLYAVVVDSRDPRSLSRFWAEALDWKVTFEADDEVCLARAEGSEPELIFVPVPEGKKVKNRLHLDLAPHDRDAEVARLEALGATRADVGQNEVTWVVMSDPEGNEFCVLTPR